VKKHSRSCIPIATIYVHIQKENPGHIRVEIGEVDGALSKFIRVRWSLRYSTNIRSIRKRPDSSESARLYGMYEATHLYGLCKIYPVTGADLSSLSHKPALSSPAVVQFSRLFGQPKAKKKVVPQICVLHGGWAPMRRRDTLSQKKDTSPCYKVEKYISLKDSPHNDGP
jgi:hypothetical protein